MKQPLKKLIMGLMVLPLAAAAFLTVLSGTAAHAETSDACSDTNISVKSGAKCAKGKGTKTNLVGGENSVIRTVSNVLLFILGAVAVIMIIIGGIRYVISNGDSSQITSAKNTILYSVIGLIVALLAYAIVNFITDSFTNDSTGDSAATN